MKWCFLICVGFFAAFASQGLAVSKTAVGLKLLEQWQLPVGTHRPEILITNDQKKNVIVVVEPEGDPHQVGSAKHRVYQFDAQTFAPIVHSFPVTFVTATQGEPADHRAFLLNDNTVVVFYQSNVFGDVPPQSMISGPAERYAQSQSLLMTKYTLDGREIFRKVLVDRVTDFSADSFPDFCILWHDGSFLVSTGSSRLAIKIRKVDTEGKILQTTQIMTPLSDHFFTIGNSLYFDGSHVHLVSAKMDPLASTLVDFTLDDDFKIIKTFYHPVMANWTQIFPTSSLMRDDLIYVVYDGLKEGDTMDGDPLQTSYSPHVKILNQAGDVLLHSQIGTDGFAHVHPTMAFSGDHLFVAWSEAMRQNSDRKTPQVRVMKYQIVSE